MINKYRVDWQAGMRLTDETFRSADEYYLSCLQPLYSVLVNSDYGFLNLPIFRYELTEATLSIIELQANAISHSGKLIQLSFSREERPLFQNINLPDTTEPFILFIDLTSDKTVKISNNSDINVPLCDADYQILVKQESEYYSNPDAVPFARFVYNHGWSMDSSFIAPCISLRANGALLRSAVNYAVELEALIRALKEAVNTQQYVMIMSALPTLNRIALETQKEADAMKPRHLITLMQEGIHILLSLSEMEEGVVVPEKERCVSFVESHYTPYVISEMINEGIHLTHLLINLPQTFSIKMVRTSEPEAVAVKPQRRISSTDSIRKKHH
ncbi:hypothetical protein [Parabacteroides pacaensis]|uniref:hypothetical protein n=1 Tax=Parabacteroides pacaensis TaxID=2086575 RepID=UPI000D106FDD|nr:hypothetical protein [Parabacteroides pacaensis]